MSGEGVGMHRYLVREWRTPRTLAVFFSPPSGITQRKCLLECMTLISVPWFLEGPSKTSVAFVSGVVLATGAAMVHLKQSMIL